MRTTMIDQIWEELESDISFSSGLLLRRYSGSSLPDIFIALKVPEKLRCIAATVSRTFDIRTTSFASLSDIKIELLPDEAKADKNILLFKLLNNKHKDIFSILCEDMIVNTATIQNEQLLIKELLNRFEKWRSLFDKIGLNGLTSEEQLGLYGESFFIRKFLQTNSDCGSVINSWMGSAREIKDFQHGSWSVEVKATHSNNHQKLQISNERQLDTSNLEALFLYHLSVETRQQSGETLNQIIDSVYGILESDISSLNRFKSKLLEYGYFDAHRNLYENKGYSMRNESFYRVEGDFPRIEETDVRNGVGDVKYSIIASQCQAFLRKEEDVFKILRFS